MTRYFFAFVILIHGLIHLVGFLKAFGYGNIQHFTKDISKSIGIFWLLITLVFILTEVLLLSRKETWWMVAIPAVLASQFLIIMYWKDAKYGTIFNVLVLLVAIIAYAEWNFNKKLKKEVTILLGSATMHPSVINHEMTRDLPVVVKKWMHHSAVIGKQAIHTVRLKQKGMMRSKPGGKWMDFTAIQYFNVDEPAFNWQVRANVMPLVFMNGRDRYENGRGEMLIKLLSVKNVVDSKGSSEMDQASMLRYLAEICWFPSAALSKYIKWQAVDDSSAMATMSYSNMSVSGIFFFNQHGDVSGFEAMRCGEFNGKRSLEKWHISSIDYALFEGIRIPQKSEVTWKLKDGDFTWLKLELETVEYNNPELF